MVRCVIGHERLLLISDPAMTDVQISEHKDSVLSRR
jgi:hypothetical protein